LVDVEVTVLMGGDRVRVLLDDVDPTAYMGNRLEVRR